MLEQVIFFTILMGFLITVLLSPIFIPFLRRLKFGQSIREEGPKSHQVKTGTPTMGGIMILFSIIITTLVMTGKFSEPSVKTYLLILVTFGFGLLGFLDDFIKVALKRNLGLTSRQKLLGQIVISVIFYLVYKENGFPTEITIPGSNYSIELGWFFCVFHSFLAGRLLKCSKFNRWT
jgi:phospho-N-acetylmuramoyl-pentapeptide-transferase